MEKVSLRWRVGEREFDCPGERDPLVHLWVVDGHGTEEEGRRKDRLRAALGLESAPVLVVDDAVLLKCVPGGLDHRGLDVVVRRWLAEHGVCRPGTMLTSETEYAATRAVESALEGLRRRGLVACGQGARRQGWTRRDAAYEARETEARARRERQAQREREREDREEAALAALAALGVTGKRGFGRVEITSEDVLRLCALATRAAS